MAVSAAPDSAGCIGSTKIKSPGAICRSWRERCGESWPSNIRRNYATSVGRFPAWSGPSMMPSCRGPPTLPCICIKCRTSPRATSSRLGWESRSWEKPWLCPGATVLAAWTAAGAQARQRFQSQPAGGRGDAGPLPGHSAELATPLSALQRGDGKCSARTENSAGGKDPRQRLHPTAPGASLGGSAGARTEPSLPRLPPRAGCLSRVSGCEARSEGLYSTQAKGDLRMDQRTDPDACSGLGRSHATPSRHRQAPGGGNLVTKKRSYAAGKI